MSTIAGIDPGQHGGVAIMDDDGTVLKVVNIPATRSGLFELLKDWSPYLTIAYVEQLHGLPHSMRGSVASFKLGQNYGEILMGLEGAGILYDTVDPRVWQTKMKCLTGGNKAISKRRAQELYPYLKKDITNSTADALLIATYGVGLIQRAAEQRERRSAGDS